MAVKLTQRQRDALTWLGQSGWTTVWWGGRPHKGWPQEMSAATYNSLSIKGLIWTRRTGGRFESNVSITSDGLEAIAKALGSES